MTTEQRIIDLEMKFSHQEIAIEALQRSVYEHQKVIEKLSKVMEIMNKRLTHLVEENEEVGPANEKPPHY